MEDHGRIDGEKPREVSGLVEVHEDEVRRQREERAFRERHHKQSPLGVGRAGGGHHAVFEAGKHGWPVARFGPKVRRRFRDRFDFRLRPS